MQRHLGLPLYLLSTSLLGWEGIGEVAGAFRLSVGETLVDLARGRGGCGLEITARTGAWMAGVDLSAEAVRQGVHGDLLAWRARKPRTWVGRRKERQREIIREQFAARGYPLPG